MHNLNTLHLAKLSCQNLSTFVNLSLHILIGKICSGILLQSFHSLPVIKTDGFCASRCIEWDYGLSPPLQLQRRIQNWLDILSLLAASITRKPLASIFNLPSQRKRNPNRAIEEGSAHGDLHGDDIVSSKRRFEVAMDEN
jgi:hypothetical protein